MRLKHPIFIALALLAAISIIGYSAWLVITGQNKFAMVLYVMGILILIFARRR